MIRLSLVLRNTGTASLVDPIYVFVATPATVFVDEAGRPRGRTEHNRLQLSGPFLPDVLPHSVSETDFEQRVDVTVPTEVTAFDLTLKAIGQNMDGARTFVLHFTVTHDQAP